MKNILLVLFASLFVSCAVAPPPVSDYSLFYERQPNSLLVLPVINETTSAEAPESFLSTIANPLIQRGYYVVPVLPGIAILQANGLYEGGQLSSVSPSVFKEVLGVDAVLYVTLHSWDTSYAVIASSVSVAMTYTMVDTTTGDILWEDSRTQVVSSDSSGGSLLVLMVNAAVTAAATDYVPLARQGNAVALTSLPAGPLSPSFEMERNRYLAE